MSDEDIDLDRVVVDPEYRRKVIAFLNGARAEHARSGAGDERAIQAQRRGLTVD